MIYAGKYNAPDYELILSKSCDLAIESTMIHHAPEVKEQLEQLGIPVLVERSSYESHPLGRMEWLKLYGVLLGKEELAKELFDEQLKQLGNLDAGKPLGRTVAFFYVSSNGYVNVRKSSDYVAKIIEMAGGSYVPDNLMENENALSTMNMQMETFYAEAKDGRLYVEPYEYYDRDAIFICSADTLLKLAAGKLDPVFAFTTGKLKVEGSLEKALKLQKFV